MARKPTTGKINAALETALADELKEIRKKHPATHENSGQFIYNIVERMRVYDRALKLEAIKSKMDSTEFGSAFNEKGE